MVPGSIMAERVITASVRRYEGSEVIWANGEHGLQLHVENSRKEFVLRAFTGI